MIWHTVLSLPSCERVVEMIAREIEEVANDRVALWTRWEVVVSGFGDPMDSKSDKDSTCERKEEFVCHREPSSRSEVRAERCGGDQA